MLMFRELVNVRYSNRAICTIPLYRTTQWGWFFTCMLYSYGNAFNEERMHSLIDSKLIKAVRFSFVEPSLPPHPATSLRPHRHLGTSGSLRSTGRVAASLAVRHAAPPCWRLTPLHFKPPAPHLF